MSTGDTVLITVAGAAPTLAALLAWNRAGKAAKAATRAETAVRGLQDRKRTEQP